MQPGESGAAAFRGWLAAHGMPETQDNFVAWTRTLVLPRHRLVLLADTVARACWPDRADDLMAVMDTAGCFDA